MLVSAVGDLCCCSAVIWLIDRPTQQVEAGARRVLVVHVLLQQWQPLHLQQQVNRLGLCGCQ